MDVRAGKRAGQRIRCPWVDIRAVGLLAAPASKTNENNYLRSGLAFRPGAPQAAPGYGLLGSADPESIQTP